MAARSDSEWKPETQDIEQAYKVVEVFSKILRSYNDHIPRGREWGDLEKQLIDAGVDPSQSRYIAYKTISGSLSEYYRALRITEEYPRPESSVLNSGRNWHPYATSSNSKYSGSLNHLDDAELEEIDARHVVDALIHYGRGIPKFEDRDGWITLSYYLYYHGVPKWITDDIYAGYNPGRKNDVLMYYLDRAGYTLADIPKRTVSPKEDRTIRARIIRDVINDFRNNHGGRLPEGSEWKNIRGELEKYGVSEDELSLRSPKYPQVIIPAMRGNFGPLNEELLIAAD